MEHVALQWDSIITKSHFLKNSETQKLSVSWVYVERYNKIYFTCEVRPRTLFKLFFQLIVIRATNIIRSQIHEFSFH